MIELEEISDELKEIIRRDITERPRRTIGILH